MPRPKGSKNRTSKPPTTSVHVRLSDDELAALAAIHASPGRAIHRMLAERMMRIGKRRYVVAAE